MKWVLMPGMDGTGALFEPLVRAKGDDFDHQILSYPQWADQSYEALTTFVLDALPQEEPFALVAESFSGPLALLAAANNPKGLRAIVLCATFVRSPVPLTGAWMTPFLSPLWFSATPTALICRALLGANPQPKLKNTLIESLKQASPAVLAARSRAVLTVDASEALRTCNVPILYLQASQDRVVWKNALRDIQATRPNLKTVKIKGPHLLLQTQPEATSAAIGQFFNDGL